MLISKYSLDKVKTEIERLEHLFQFVFPQQYRAFLLKYNGGDTPETKFKVGKISSDLRAFLGFGNVTYSMADDTELKKWIEKKLFPIAVDSFGNYIVIGLEKGEIYFSDHERNYKCIKLTDNLEEFISHCKSTKIGKILSIEEREQMIRKNGFKGEVSELRRQLWQKEIDEYQQYKQEKIILD